MNKWLGDYPLGGHGKVPTNDSEQSVAGGGGPPYNPRSPEYADNHDGGGGGNHQRRWRIEVFIALLGLVVAAVGLAAFLLAYRVQIGESIEHFGHMWTGQQTPTKDVTPLPRLEPPPEEKRKERYEVLAKQQKHTAQQLAEVRKQLDHLQRHEEQGGRGFKKGDAIWLEVPYSFSEEDLQRHLNRWSDGCNVTPERISRESTLAGETCGLNGTCVIVSKSCKDDTFDDIDPAYRPATPRK